MAAVSTIGTRGAAYQARTRSLIMLGGLVDKAGLTGILGIGLDGEPLPADQAAILLGGLVQLRSWVENDPAPPTRLNTLKARGKDAFTTAPEARNASAS